MSVRPPSTTIKATRAATGPGRTIAGQVIATVPDAVSRTNDVLGPVCRGCQVAAATPEPTIGANECGVDPNTPVSAATGMLAQRASGIRSGVKSEAEIRAGVEDETAAEYERQVRVEAGFRSHVLDGQYSDYPKSRPGSARP